MCSSIEIQRAKERGQIAMHDAIVRVPGGSRFQRDGKPIRYFGPKEAGRVIARSADEVRNMCCPNKPDHRMYADDMHELLLEGMDPVWFEECLRDVGVICIPVPDIRGHADLSMDLMKAVKEFGDIGRVMADALTDDKVTRKEFQRFEREAGEAMGAIAELIEAMRKEVG